MYIQALCYGVRSCRSYVIFHSFTGGGGGGGKTAIQEYFELFDFSEKSAMEHFNVIFEKDSSKESSEKTYNEHQNLHLSTDSIFMVSDS